MKYLNVGLYLLSIDVGIRNILNIYVIIFKLNSEMSSVYCVDDKEIWFLLTHFLLFLDDIHIYVFM